MQYWLVFRRYAPFAEFGMGFEGDHRTGPSVSMNVTARTIGTVPFARGAVGAVTASSSGTDTRVAAIGFADWPASTCRK